MFSSPNNIIGIKVFFVMCNYQKQQKGQETSKCNLEREYRDCIKSRRDKIGITGHIMMHQVLYIVQLPNEEGDMHITWCILVIPILSLLLLYNHVLGS